ncbi:polysaccharide biosynthesis tyrosine autokinase [Cellulomonas endophytica]|uniref:polysaccharide biosynthesis tyrosine autokinase n=1 Tax=Cellulomonas endophytica TaxID=2494735 RepID=UPI0010106EA4|nr:polysaccharide biosynthesis tyrosine autokinase [Cellulomonas endophytica]
MRAHDLLTSFRKRWLWILVPFLVVVSGITFLSLEAPKIYRSSASMYVSLSIGRNAADLNQGSSFTQSQMQSFARLASLPIVLEPVVEDLGLDTTASRLAGRVTATTPANTVLLTVTVSGRDPEETAQIADAVSEELADVVTRISPSDEAGQSTVAATVIDSADVASSPASPNVRRNVVAAALAGLLLGLVAAYLRDLLDTRVRLPEDVDSSAGVPVLAQVPAARRNAATSVLSTFSSDRQAEEYGRLRVNLQMIGRVNEPRVFVFSSALPGEGKSTSAIRVALSFAASGARTLLVDADLRRPAVASYLSFEGSAGLTDCLIGRAEFEDVRQEVMPNLSLLASGAVPPNPSELLSSSALEQLLDQVRQEFDVIVVDAPPLLPVADAVILSRTATGVILVADVQQVRRAQLRKAVDAVRLGGGRVVGAVLNRVSAGSEQVYGYNAVQPAEATGRRHGRREDVAAEAADAREARVR